MQQTKLFLDDYRNPEMVWKETINPVYEKNESWIIVRSFEAFIEYISNNGLPDLISFDHDLSLAHYLPENQTEIDYEKMTEKSGYHAAVWLINYCRTTSNNLPICLVHSQNKVGKQNIEQMLSEFSP